jgi:copper chaperone CopZ
MKSFIPGLVTLLFIIALSTFGVAQSSDTQVMDTVVSVTLNVKGITCGNDLPIINKNVMDLDGVASCNAVGKAKPTTVFTIDYNPNLISEKEIIMAVEDSPSCDFPDQKPYKVKGKK